MTSPSNKNDLILYATSLIDGGPVKKADVLAFMRAFLDLDLQEKTSVELDGQALPGLPFEIEKTDSGIHMPRESNRSYTKAEAMALVAAIIKALE